MAIFPGYGGKVIVAAATIADLDNWTLDISRKTIDVAAFNDSDPSWDAKYPMSGAWSGKAKGRWNMGDTAGQKVLQDSLIGTVATVTMKFYIDTAKYYTGTAYVTGISVDQPRDGIVTADFTFEGTGALTCTIA